MGKKKLLNTAQAQKLNNSYQGYVQNPIEQVETPIIEGYFYKESTVKDMAIRKVNKSLCGLLIMAVLTTFVSYYFVMCNELSLNTLNRQIIALNDENSELQNNLDRLKSFSNVDKTFQQNNMLKRAGQVIETEAVDNEASENVIRPSKKRIFNYAIGF